jgi:hypothetical protein
MMRRAKTATWSRLLCLSLTLVFLLSMSGISFADTSAEPADVVAEEAPAEAAPVVEEPAEEPPAEEPPAEEPPAEEPPAEEPPADEPPAEEPPAEEPAAEEPPADALPVQEPAVKQPAAPVERSVETEEGDSEVDCHGCITIHKWNDIDGDGCWDDNEPPIEGWTFYVNRFMSRDTWQVTTDCNGVATLCVPTGLLLPRLYSVTEECREGWVASTDAMQWVWVHNNMHHPLYFGNHETEITKRFRLIYQGAPEGARFAVRYCIEGEPNDDSIDCVECEQMPLVPGQLPGRWVGSAEIPWGSELCVKWYINWDGQWRLLGETCDGPLYEDALNEFEWTSRICGAKYEDLDRDGQWDEGEPGLPDWEIHLNPYVENGNDLETVDPNGAWRSKLTNDEGRYCFYQLPPGVFMLSEVLPEGWTQTESPEPIEISAENRVVYGARFGNYRDDVEKTWELTYDKAPAGVEFKVQYDLNGGTQYVDLTETGPGVYSFEETLQWGDEITNVIWWAVYMGEWIELGTSEDEVLEAEVVLNDFYYDPWCGGNKYEDQDGDGEVDEGEPGLPGWTINLYRLTSDNELPSDVVANGVGVLYDSTVTGEGGAYEFTGMLPGCYYVEEVLQEGYRQTGAPDGPFCVENGSEVGGLDFLNEPFIPFTPPDLALEKVANPTLAIPGDTVEYTISVENVGEGAAVDYTVTDDYDERYMEVVDANGGTDDGDTITWTFPGPLAPGASFTITYTMRVLEDVPEDLESIDNIACVDTEADENPDNNCDDATVEIEPALPFTEEEEFLPFTGGDAATLLLFATLATMVGLALRKLGSATA